MTTRFWKSSLGVAAFAACALAGATVAVGAGSGSKGSGTTTSTTASSTPRGHTPETALAGDTLAKVKAAAIAKVGGTVDSATTENDSANSGAVYEAHVTRADGSHVTVILDSSFVVLAVETGQGGRGGPGDHGEEAARRGPPGAPQPVRGSRVQ